MEHIFIQRENSRTCVACGKDITDPLHAPIQPIKVDNFTGPKFPIKDRLEPRPWR